jgi:hypothetical protein
LFYSSDSKYKSTTIFEIIMKILNTTIFSLICLSFLSPEKTFAEKARVPFFNTCAEMQNYFNYKSRNYDGGKTKYVGFETVAMNFRGNDIARVDNGLRYCVGGYIIEKTPVGTEICRGYIRREAGDDPSLLYGHGLYNEFNSFRYAK